MINARKNCYDDVERQICHITDNMDSQVVLKSRQTYLEEFRDFIMMIKLVGGMLSGILALIGILNFINAIVTSIISRKRELAMMNAVRMTGLQLRKMLIWEDVHYSVLTMLCSLIIGTLLSRAVAAILGDMFYFTYHFTLLPVLICTSALLLLSAMTASVSYRAICRDSIVERLREN